MTCEIPTTSFMENSRILDHNEKSLVSMMTEEKNVTMANPSPKTLPKATQREIRVSELHNKISLTHDEDIDKTYEEPQELSREELNNEFEAIPRCDAPRASLKNLRQSLHQCGDDLGAEQQFGQGLDLDCA